MGFKRYGGDIERSTIGAGGRLTGFAFTVSFLGGIAAFGFESLLILVSLIVIALIILAVESLSPKPHENPRKEQLFLQLLDDTNKNYTLGKDDEAIECIRREKKHGKLPEYIVDIERIVTRRKAHNSNPQPVAPSESQSYALISHEY